MGRNIIMSRGSSGHKPNNAEKRGREKYRLKDKKTTNKRRKLKKHIKKQPNDNVAKEARQNV